MNNILKWISSNNLNPSNLLCHFKSLHIHFCPPSNNPFHYKCHFLSSYWPITHSIYYPLTHPTPVTLYVSHPPIWTIPSSFVWHSRHPFPISYLQLVRANCQIILTNIILSFPIVIWQVSGETIIKILAVRRSNSQTILPMGNSK